MKLSFPFATFAMLAATSSTVAVDIASRNWHARIKAAVASSRAAVRPKLSDLYARVKKLALQTNEDLHLRNGNNLSPRSPRIVGGVPADPSEFPSMAIPDYTELLGENINTCG
jgi:hypothetical protein